MRKPVPTCKVSPELANKVDSLLGGAPTSAMQKPAVTCVNLAIADVVIDEDRDETGDVTDELLSSVRNLGVLTPILVDPETWTVLDGRRRYKAAVAAGMKTIPVTCVDNADPGVVGITCNMHRMDMSARERARKYKGTMQRLGWPAARLAKELGLAPSTVSNDLALLEAPPAVQQEMDAGTISVHAARAAGREARRVKRVSSAEKKCTVPSRMGRKRTQIRLDTHLPDSVQSAVVRSDEMVLTVRVPRDVKWTGVSLIKHLNLVAVKIAQIAEQARAEQLDLLE